MISATISADVIASTALSGAEMEGLTERINVIFGKIDDYYSERGKGSTFSRLVKGDYIECLIKNPQDALRVALILKYAIKSYPLDDIDVNSFLKKKRKLFQSYGVRLAIGIGDMELDMMDVNILRGDAIIRSGRLISNLKTSNKEKITIKNSLFFDSPNQSTTDTFSAIVGLIDEISRRSTPRQSEIILWKLFGWSEQEIKDEFNIGQSNINEQSKAAGWSQIERALLFYEQYDFNK